MKDTDFFFWCFVPGFAVKVKTHEYALPWSSEKDKRQKREFQLLLFHSVMHQRYCGIIEKSNFIWTKFPCVIPIQPIQGQAQTVSMWNFLILLFAYLSLCRLHDGKSLSAISKSPLDRQQLGHPWGSKTESSSVTSWTYNGAHHRPPKTLL